MLIDLQVQPYLELTSILDINQTTIQFDQRWFNLTATGGIVAANVSYWDSTRITWMIHNDSLTDLTVWFNGSTPLFIYLDEVDTPSAWSYAGGVAKINATTARNVTASWALHYFYLRLYYYPGIDTVSINGSVKANASLTAVAENTVINVTSTLDAGYNFSHYDFCFTLCNRSISNPKLFDMTQNATLYVHSQGGGAGNAQWGILLIIPIALIAILYITRRKH